MVLVGLALVIVGKDLVFKFLGVISGIFLAYMIYWSLKYAFGEGLELLFIDVAIILSAIGSFYIYKLKETFVPMVLSALISFVVAMFCESS